MRSFVGPGAAGPGGDAAEQQVAAAGHHGLPAGLDHRGGQFLGDDGGAVDGVAGLQAGPCEQVHVGPGAVGEHGDLRLADRPPRRGVVYLDRTVLGISAQLLLGAHDLDGDGLDDDRLVAHQEREAAGVGGLERAGHLIQRAGRDDRIAGYQVSDFLMPLPADVKYKAKPFADVAVDRFAKGAGAALAGLVTAIPQLIWLSEHKRLVFISAGALLAISGIALWVGRLAPCPADPKLARSCQRLRRLSVVVYSIALAAFMLGGAFAFLLPVLAQ